MALVRNCPDNQQRGTAEDVRKACPTIHCSPRTHPKPDSRAQRAHTWTGRFRTDAHNPWLEWPPVFAWPPPALASLSQLDLEPPGLFVERLPAYQRFSLGNLGAGVPSPGNSDTAFALELPGLFAERLPAYQRFSLGNLGAGVPSPGSNGTAFASGGLS